MTTVNETAPQRLSFSAELDEQRWDDHRYYHRSYVNQSLHLLSACCFLSSYVLIFVNPIAAVMIGWLLAMISRQSGHFFFEPKTYDEVNQATHAYKEEIKVGYNLYRKIWLLSIWVALPVVLWVTPSFFGALEARGGFFGFLHNLCLLWFVLGLCAILARGIHLMIVRTPQTGLVWMTKILTDPFHDIYIYHQAPLRLLRGERHDPMNEWHGRPRSV